MTDLKVFEKAEFGSVRVFERRVPHHPHDKDHGQGPNLFRQSVPKHDGKPRVGSA